MTTQEKIERLIPYAHENFMKYPLFEEGDYRPTLSFWKIFDENTHSLKAGIDYIKENLPILKNKYGIYFNWIIVKPFSFKEIDFEIKNQKTKYMCEFSIYCKNDVLEDSSYSLDNMLDIGNELLNNNYNWNIILKQK